MSATKTPRSIVIEQIKLLLGNNMVDLEFDQAHLNTAVTIAIERLRQRSDGALEEEDIFITLQPGQQEYTLPAEVQEVRRLYRRGIGSQVGSGLNFDPLQASYMQGMFMNGSQIGGLATWDLFNGYMETAERVFASQLNFTWHNSTKKLTIIRLPKAQEDVGVRVWTTKAEDAVLLDPYSGPWIRSYALAISKGMLGQARGKYAQGFSGPSGSVVLNGDALIQQSIAEMEILDKELDNGVAGTDGYSFIIG